jgi:SAM-dependent methyltransferase
MRSAIVPQSTDQLLARFREAKGSARLSRDELEQAYWGFHPRFRFFKTVPRNARLLDLGANSGGLAQWRGWGLPDRPDISMYGVDLASGEFSHLYAEWESLNLDDAMPSFPGVIFDSFLCSHLIEHIERPEELIGWMAKKSVPGARLYLEWPNVTSLDLPNRSELVEGGWPVMISNFHDDDTHIRLKSIEEISELVSASGFAIVESGVIDAGDLTDQLIDMGHSLDDAGMTLAGFWSLTHWATYLIAERV